MNIKIHYLFVIALTIGLASCSSQKVVDEIDSNSDQIMDIKVISEGDYLHTEVDRDYDGKVDRIFKWDNNGRLIEDTVIHKDVNGKELRSTFKYMNIRRYEYDGMHGWMGDLDIDATYDERSRDVAKPYRYFVFKNQLVFKEVDVDRDGTFEKRTIYKDFAPTDRVLLDN